MTPEVSLDVAVPIVGQPYAIKTWSLSTVLQCRCEANEPLLLQGPLGAQVQCPSCRTIFTLRSFQVIPNSDRVGFSIDVDRA